MKLYKTTHRLLLDKAAPSPLNNDGRTDHSGYNKEANFDTNMVIILAALLCALIFVLGLNSIVRCALRCSRRIAFESPNSTVARLAVTGIKKRKLREIPMSVYSSGTDIFPATDCPICLSEFMDGEKVRVLPRCHHVFHVRCIDIWLASRSSCPTCRQSLLEQPPPLAEEGLIIEGGIRHHQQEPRNDVSQHGHDLPGFDEEIG